MSGILMDKATGKPFLDFDGHEVKAETTFTPESRDGTVDVIFKFNSLNSKLDTDVVVFETLYREGMELTTHADIDDEGQTVKIRVPEIGTTATSEDGHRVDPLGEVKITDEVSYKNLKPGKEYTVSGVLMNKVTGEVFLDAAGNEIRSEVVFTPEEPTGTVTVEFTFDASDLHGTQIVVFEHLYYDGLLLATHAELEDEGQTVEILSLIHIYLQKGAGAYSLCNGFTESQWEVFHFAVLYRRRNGTAAIHRCSGRRRSWPALSGVHVGQPEVRKSKASG